VVQPLCLDSCDYSIDFRIKVVGYRNSIFDKKAPFFIGADNPFVATSEEIVNHLSTLVADGIGEEALPTLDAIQLLVKKIDWIKPSEGHRVVIVLTDASSRPETADDNSAMAVAVDAASKRFRFHFCGSATTNHQIFGKIPKSSFTQTYKGLHNFDWDYFFERILKMAMKFQACAH